jgi:hypothetical protein
MSVAAPTVQSMTNTTATTAGTTAPRRGIRVVQLPSGLQRVTRERGGVLGYVEQREVAGAPRWVAKRMRQSDLAFVELGTFWTRDDALEVVLSA